jgi:NDP-sugar pyrophosphorylase family protein
VTLNIVIPMAGKGSRFAREGYQLPKPLIPVHGVPMIDVVVTNLRPLRPHRFIFLCLKEHVEQYRLDDHLVRIAPGSELIYVETVTEGAACTVLLARDLIENDEPLMIANSDQWVDVSIDSYLAAGDTPEVDGLIMTMSADDPKWSFVRFDLSGNVVEVVEKEVVSNEATVGIYNFRQGRDFVAAADEMIRKNLRVNNEFYVAPVYNQLIDAGRRIAVFGVGSELDGMYGLGIPSDLKAFESLPVSRKAVAFA